MRHCQFQCCKMLQNTPVKNGCHHEEALVMKRAQNKKMEMNAEEEN